VKSCDANHTKSMRRNKRGKRERGGGGWERTCNKRQFEATAAADNGGVGVWGGAASAPTSCQPGWDNPWSRLLVVFDCMPSKRYPMYRLPTVLAADIVLSPPCLRGKCRCADLSTVIAVVHRSAQNCAFIMIPVYFPAPIGGLPSDSNALLINQIPCRYQSAAFHD
jgi:hypothetical protein